jgi:dCMP deaminase
MRHTRTESLMMMAEIVSLRGTCSRKKVGVVFAIDGRVLMTGYNGAPAGLPHCDHQEDSPCETAVHAEANAIAYAARSGVALKGSQVYCTAAPCLNCAKLLVNAGISELYWAEPYRNNQGSVLLAQAGIPVHRQARLLEFAEQEGLGVIDGEAVV